MSAALPSLELDIAGGTCLCVPGSIDQLTPYVLLEQEDWFEDEIRFVRRWLKPGMQAVDVGANFGVYTLAMARAVGASGRVWCFEPTAGTADYLQRSLELNRCEGVELARAAVSDHDGSIGFAIGLDSEMNAVANTAAAGGEIVQVPAVTLDRCATESGWREVDLLKLDVEGHELQAIQGGAEFLRACSPLLMFEIQVENIIDLRPLEPLAQLGYAFFRLVPGPLWLVPFEPSELHGLRLLNLFACKPDRAAKLAAANLLVQAEDTETGTPSPAAWRSLVRRMPYASAMAQRWPAKAGYFSGPGTAEYLEGLAAYAQSRDESLRVSERYAWLNHAFRCVAEALDLKPTLARRISCARIGFDLGLYELPLEASTVAMRQLGDEAEAALAEGFLAPLQRYEERPQLGDASAWLKCAVVEQLEKGRALSSAFVGATSLDLLAPIRGLAPCSPEVERRWQLVRMRHGLQARPEPAAVLRARSDENLNPHFWSGAQAFVHSSLGPR